MEAQQAAAAQFKDAKSKFIARERDVDLSLFDKVARSGWKCTLLMMAGGRAARRDEREARAVQTVRESEHYAPWHEHPQAAEPGEGDAVRGGSRQLVRNTTHFTRMPNCFRPESETY